MASFSIQHPPIAGRWQCTVGRYGAQVDIWFVFVAILGLLKIQYLIQELRSLKDPNTAYLVGFL